MTDDELFQSLEPHLRKSEAPVPHFYLDTNGHLTIGVGHLVIRSEEANDKKKLKEALDLLLNPVFQMRKQVAFIGPPPAPPPQSGRWCVKSLGADFENAYCNPVAVKWDEEVLPTFGGSGFAEAPAGDDELYDALLKEAQAVMADSASQVAAANKKAWYAWTHKTSFRMSNQGMLALKKVDFARTLKEVRAKFKKFDTYPVAARKAIVDIAYQYGAGGAYSRIGALAEAADWAGVIKAWTGLKDFALYKERNAQRILWFTEAKKEADVLKPKAATAAIPEIPKVPPRPKLPPLP